MEEHCAICGHYQYLHHDWGCSECDQAQSSCPGFAQASSGPAEPLGERVAGFDQYLTQLLEIDERSSQLVEEVRREFRQRFLKETMMESKCEKYTDSPRTEENSSLVIGTPSDISLQEAIRLAIIGHSTRERGFDVNASYMSKKQIDRCADIAAQVALATAERGGIDREKLLANLRELSVQARLCVRVFNLDTLDEIIDAIEGGGFDHPAPPAGDVAAVAAAWARFNSLRSLRGMEGYEELDQSIVKLEESCAKK